MLDAQITIFISEACINNALLKTWFKKKISNVIKIQFEKHLLLLKLYVSV